jgi:DNA-directed RNA polymerase specialized sigma24 family protein
LSLDAAENISEETDSMDSLLQQKITIEYVEQALDQIDPEQREVVVLRSTKCHFFSLNRC